MPFPDVSLPSNSELLALIGDPPHGILALLDDQSQLPTPSDTAFATSALQAHSRSPLFARPKHRRRRGAPKQEPRPDRPADEFVLRHFAGSIKYTAAGFVEKNTDKLPADALSLLSRSSVPLVAALFGGGGAGAAAAAAGGGGRRAGSGTVSAAFSESLRDLAKTLGDTSSYFIRCVRPRGGVHGLDGKALTRKSKSLHAGGSSSEAAMMAMHGEQALMHGSVVLQQLEASGVLEAVSLMTLGFPTRIPYEAIHGKYSAMLPAWASELSPRQLVEAIALASEVPSRDVAYGHTSLFCRAGKAVFLERLLGGDGNLESSAEMIPQLQGLLADFERRRQAMPIVVKNLQMWVHRRRFLAMKAIKRQNAQHALGRLRHVGWQVGKAAGVGRLMHSQAKDAERRRMRLQQLKRAFRGVTIATAATGGWAAAAAESGDAATQDEAARRIQAAFAQRRERLDQHAQQQHANARRSAANRAFRAAAKATLAFAGSAARLKAAAAAKVDGVFEGAVVHAGHLHLVPRAGNTARVIGGGGGSGGGEGEGAAAAISSSDGGGGLGELPPASAATLVPPGEYYCVLLSSRVLLCFEIGEDQMVSGTFDPASGAARGVRPIDLTEGAQVRIQRGTHLAANGASGEASGEGSGGGAGGSFGGHAAAAHPAALGFELIVSEGCVVRLWRAAPALYDEGAKGAVARAVRTWVRCLSATMVPENMRGSRASLARTTTMLLLGDEADDDDEEEEDGKEAEKKRKPKEPAHMAGQWADGCYYRGDGSVAYYTAPCPDDPYAAPVLVA